MDNNQIDLNDGTVLRKRGRPAGRNRVPLSLEERRARNARYERERRVEMTDALAELAEAAGCEPSISGADLLATVISQLQHAARRKHSSDAESLRRCNKNLMAQIVTLEKRLAGDPDAVFSHTEQELNRPHQGKRKRDDYEGSPLVAYAPQPMDSPPVVQYSSSDSSTSGHKCLPSHPRSPDEAFGTESNFAEHRYSPEYKFLSQEHYFSNSSSSAAACHSLPVPKTSPLSDSSSCPSPDQGIIDYSGYQFAGSQVPTPEYRIPAEPSEQVLPGPCYSQYQEYYGHEVCPPGYGPPAQPPLPPPAAIPEIQYPAPFIHQPRPNAHAPAVGHDNVYDMPALAVDNLIQPEFGHATGSPAIDRHQMRFLSTEDLISLYL